MVIQEMICTLFSLGVSCGSWPMKTLLIEYLLVPTVILIIFLYITSDFLLRGINLKLKGLVTIVLYIVLVYSGLYGTFAAFAYNYVVLFLIVGMAIFFLERFISRDWISGGIEGAGKLYEKAKEKKKEAPTEDNLWDLVIKCDQLDSRIRDLRDDKQRAEGRQDRERVSSIEEDIKRERRSYDEYTASLTKTYRNFKKAGKTIRDDELRRRLERYRLK